MHLDYLAYRDFPPSTVDPFLADPASQQAAADVQFTAVGSAPVAALTGPGGDVTDDQPILLNATASTDPDSTPALQRLRFTWTCRREDHPTPCFSSADQGDQTGVPGVWSLKAGTLTNDKLHTFTVTVSKEVAAGATPLSATASISVRPRSAAVPFPRGSLKRQCDLSGCAAPHSTDRPLVLSLVLESAFAASAVRWSSADVPAVSGLTAASSATDPTIPAGTHYLTVPAALLPGNRAALIIAANLSLAGATGLATTTVSLNSAPSCSLGASASECLAPTVVSDTFPNAAVSLLAQGWADAQDDSQLLRYEFGVRTSTAGGRTSDSAQQIGGSAGATLLGLPVGNSTLYCCVIDTAGSRTCATTIVTVKPPGSGFNAAAALESVNITALAQAGDQRTLLQAASQMSQIVAALGGSSSGGGNGTSLTAPTAEQQQLVAARSATLISAILSGASLGDPEQRTQAISAIAAIASSAAAIVSDDSRQMFADAAAKAVDSLSSGTGDGDLVDLATQLCRLLGAALPTGGSVTSARSGRRSLLDSSSAAQASIQNLLDVGRKVGNALGQQAVPGGGNEAAGDAGVFVSVGALPTSTGGSGSVGVTVTAGPATSSSGTSSPSSASSTTSSRSALTHRRHLAQTTTTTATGARAALVLSGALASGAAGYGLVLSYAPSASVALQQALAAALPATSTLRGGLATVGWTAGSSPPALDGTASYVRLQLPAPSYDATRSGSCARYDEARKSLATDAAPAVFESYDSATGLVTCRLTVSSLAAGGGGSSSSISGGAVAGIVIGAVVGAVLLAAVALVVVRRRRCQQAVQPSSPDPGKPAVTVVAVPAAQQQPQQPQQREGVQRWSQPLPDEQPQASQRHAPEHYKWAGPSRN
ncbi:hypothetical protein HYH02_013941 [Chlamydomonas schloesseri]|uniref:PKD/REJ-like domain-containing protein n=1 Tax=Chlamydomonas schloesseri TaxID=2026947 RepID=A0A835SQJ7_9CHLO|nr:hypothetical protein HYH02_013941 [Chlamydomonas schloesseri]|eukprot:KAG2429991.1 hypothetical protein HYH02_013941 [Chlamydomonas schloesseri]